MTSAKDVKAFVNTHPPDLKACLRQEIQFQCVTHPKDVEARKDLYKYKVNKLVEEDMIENLTVLLDDSFVEEAIVFQQRMIALRNYRPPPQCPIMIKFINPTSHWQCFGIRGKVDPSLWVS